MDLGIKREVTAKEAKRLRRKQIYTGAEIRPVLIIKKEKKAKQKTPRGWF